MTQKLVPCPGCSRHVMLGERRCPFCAGALGDELAAGLVPPARTRMKRAAAFVFSTTLGLAGCASTTSGNDAAATDNGTDTAPRTDTPSPTDSPVSTDVSRDTGTDTGTDTGRDAPEDHGNIQPPYGVPADAGPPDDAGGAMADYGAPPPPMDAGR